MQWQWEGTPNVINIIYTLPIHFFLCMFSGSTLKYYHLPALVEESSDTAVL